MIRKAAQRRLLKGAKKALRGRAVDWAGHLTVDAPYHWVRDDGRTVEISDLEASGDRVAFRVQVLGTAGALEFEYFHVITNPPLAVPDGGADADGRPTYRRDVAGAVRRLVDDRLEGLMS